MVVLASVLSRYMPVQEAAPRPPPARLVHRAATIPYHTSNHTYTCSTYNMVIYPSLSRSATGLSITVCSHGSQIRRTPTTHHIFDERIRDTTLSSFSLSPLQEQSLCSVCMGPDLGAGHTFFGAACFFHRDCFCGRLATQGKTCFSKASPSFRGPRSRVLQRGNEEESISPTTTEMSLPLYPCVMRIHLLQPPSSAP